MVLWLLAHGSFAPQLSAETPARPKYGKQAVRLHQDHAYLQQHPAPDYWALSPYYCAQPDDRSCSSASAAMVINALRAGRTLQADEPLASPQTVVDAAPPEQWRRLLAPDGPGVTLDELAKILPTVCQAFPGAEATVETLRFEGAAGRASLRQLLIENERTANDFLIVNFLQSIATDDPEGAVGHLAPVAAFDAANDRVLLLDPDRRWYEPYWISTATLQEAMATRDAVSHRPRGLLHIRRQVKPAMP